MAFLNEKIIFDSRFIGSNLYKYVIEIAEKKDVYLLLPQIFVYDSNIHGIVLNDNSKFNNSMELDALVFKFRKCYLTRESKQSPIVAHKIIHRGHDYYFTGETYNIPLDL